MIYENNEKPAVGAAGVVQECGQHSFEFTSIRLSPQENSVDSGGLLFDDCRAEDLRDRHDFEANPLLAAALRYAKKGHSVIPLRPRGKTPATARGHNDATTDVDQIRRWWKEMPDANIGLRTGAILAVDIDNVAGIENQWLKSKEGVAALECSHCIAKTGRGGYHAFYQNPDAIRNSAGKLAQNVDVRGEGGYVVVPPSIHENCMAYQWIYGDLQKHAPHELTHLPESIRRKCLGKKPTKSDTSIPEGRRNDALFKLACRLRRSGLSTDDIHGGVMRQNLARCTPPLHEDEVSRIVASAINATATDTSSYDEAENSITRSLTDIGNAERFSAAVSDRIRWNPQTNKYLTFVGTHWCPDDAAVHEAAKTVLRGIPDEVAHVVRSLDLPADIEEKLQKKVKKHAVDSQSAHRFAAMIRLARSESGMEISTSEMDADPYQLNVANGTLELRSGVLRQHAARDYFSYCLPIKYEKNARAERWEEFLSGICCGDEELTAFLGRLAGYFLTGDVSEQVAVLFWGTGSNGKSVFVDKLMALLGPLAIRSESAVIASKQQTAQGGRATPEIARLFGKRLAVSNELDIGVRLNESVVKDLVGGDTLTARHLYGHPFDFKPTHKILILGNHLPSVRGSDFGIWRRLLLVPFRSQFTAEIGNLDANLESKLRRELPGILAWAVLGCLQWQREGLGIPEAVRQATKEFRADTDLLTRFLADECQVGDELVTTCDDLRRAYNSWADKVGESHISSRTLGLKLSENGFKKTKEGGRRGWRGLRPMGIGAQYNAWR